MYNALKHFWELLYLSSRCQGQSNSLFIYEYFCFAINKYKCLLCNLSTKSEDIVVYSDYQLEFSPALVSAGSL